MPSLLRVFAAAALLTLPASPAFAHAHLLGSMPAADAAVAPPDRLELTFSEAVTAAFSGAAVTGPAGQVETGAATPRPGQPDVLVVPLPALAPGSYRVEWHALAADGHKTAGHFGFTVRP